MKVIVWLFSCLLLIGFFENPTLTSAEHVARSRNESEVGREKVTRLFPASDYGTADSDILQLRKFLNELFTGGNEVQSVSSRGGRTFGHKRIQFMLMPMIYKMGVMMTMLTVLTVISLKGLLIGIVLLVLKLSTVFAKFMTGWHATPAQPWPSQQQPIHVHVHNSFPYAHQQAYSGWMSASGPEDDGHYYYKG